MTYQANGLTLGLETSGPVGTVALRRDRCLVECVRLETDGRRHAQTLAAEVDRLLRSNGQSAQELNLIAVSIGPGSFTGLRVGVVFAKTLGYALGCQVVAVDTFCAIAANSPSDVSEVVVLADAQRGELFAGRYMPSNGGVQSATWPRCGEIAIVSAADLCQQLAQHNHSVPPIAVSGPAAESLSTMLPSSVRLLDSSCWIPRADVVAQLGEEQAERNEFAKPWTLEPFYLRRSAAEEKANM